MKGIYGWGGGGEEELRGRRQNTAAKTLKTRRKKEMSTGFFFALSWGSRRARGLLSKQEATRVAFKELLPRVQPQTSGWCWAPLPAEPCCEATGLAPWGLQLLLSALHPTWLTASPGQPFLPAQVQGPPSQMVPCPSPSPRAALHIQGQWCGAQDFLAGQIFPVRDGMKPGGSRSFCFCP